MRTIYIDSEFKCHTVNDGTMTAVESDFFDDAYVNGHRYVPTGESWTDSNGKVYPGEMIVAWKDFAQLDAAQREYERAMIADMRNALNKLGVTLDE